MSELAETLAPYRVGRPSLGYRIGRETVPLRIRLVVKIKILRRFAVLQGKGKPFPDAAYGRLADAFFRLYYEQQVLFPPKHPYVLDRLTGNCASPSIKILRKIMDGRCLVCNAQRGEPCDAGLHS